jgi:hypothetical protein
LAKKFITKGKGANRKVIPISDKKGRNRVGLSGYAVSYPLEPASEAEREFESSKEYVYKKLDDVEDFISLSQNFDESDFKKYPGLKKVDEYLEESHTIAKNAAMNAKLMMKRHGGNVGPLAQSIHNGIHETLKFNYEAYTKLDEIIKKARQANENDMGCPTHEGYSLSSIMADITDMEEDLYSADAILMKTFRNMRRAQYREYRSKHPISLHASGSMNAPGRKGDVHVVGAVSMIFNPDGSLRIREFPRDTLS